MLLNSQYRPNINDNDLKQYRYNKVSLIQLEFTSFGLTLDFVWFGLVCFVWLGLVCFALFGLI